jgi:hypothetical protein
MLPPVDPLTVWLSTLMMSVNGRPRRPSGRNTEKGVPTVSIDLGTLLAAQRTLRVARTDYDFTRDGGGQYTRVGNTEVIPSGSIIIGYSILTTVAITTATGATLCFACAGFDMGPASASLGYIVGALRSAVAGAVLAKDEPILPDILTGSLTAGAATCWVYYLPTTG